VLGRKMGMRYISSNYDNNPNAPMGSWAGIDSKGVLNSGTTTTDPKEDDEENKDAMLLEVDEVGFVFDNGHTLYLECISRALDSKDGTIVKMNKSVIRCSYHAYPSAKP
jgi:hypothetical protein